MKNFWRKRPATSTEDIEALREANAETQRQLNDLSAVVQNHRDALNELQVHVVALQAANKPKRRPRKET